MTTADREEFAADLFAVLDSRGIDLSAWGELLQWMSVWAAFQLGMGLENFQEATARLWAVADGSADVN